MARMLLLKAFGVDFSHYKTAEFKKDEATEDVLQVIGAGLPRTGTSSLKAALETLGFDPCHHMIDCIKQPGRADLFNYLLQSHQKTKSLHPSSPHLIQLQAAMRGYRASIDSPVNDLYAPLLQIYPNAKVILSVRDSDAAWWRSFSDTLGVQLTTRCRVLVYPVAFLRSQTRLLGTMVEGWKGVGVSGELGPWTHGAWNREVEKTVPRERLLVFNVKMGWSPLCEFLGVEVPDVAFPNMNDTATVKKAMFGGQAIGACVWLLYFLLAGLSVMLLLKPQLVLG